MRYFVQIVPRDESYIEALPISDEAKRLHREVHHGGDRERFGRIPRGHRPKAGSPYFTMRLPFTDFWGDGRDHTVDFVVKDAGAAVGVLELVWVDFK